MATDGSVDINRRALGASRAATLGLCLWAVGAQWTEAVAACGMALTTASLIFWPEGRAPLKQPKALLMSWAPLLAFLLWAWVAPSVSGRPPTWGGAARILDWLGVPFAARAFQLLQPRQKRRVAWAAGATLLLSTAFAVCQHFGLLPPPSFFAALSWTHVSFYRMYEPVPDSPHHFMAGGLLWHRLKFAHVEGMATLWALSLGVLCRNRRRWVALVLAAIGFVSVLALPYARAASVVLCICVLGVLAVGLNRRWALFTGLAVFSLAATLLFAVPSQRERLLASGDPKSNGNRSELLAAGLRAIRAHPWTGFGPGRFRPSRVAVPGMSQNVLEHGGKAHNQFISLAAETGIPGALLFCVLLGWLWARMKSPVGVLAGRAILCFFVLLCFFHDPLFHAEFSMGLTLSLGAALALRDTT